MLKLLPANAPKMLSIVSCIATVLLSACNHVEIHDHEFCADFGPDGAHCANFLSTATRDIPKAEWDLEREDKMICEKSEVFADWKATLEKLCSVSKKCNYDEVKAIESFFDRIELQNIEQLKKHDGGEQGHN